jgi:cytosine/uracil/thiamine/allantoin permease
VVMAIIWYGVQAYIGGMLSSISPPFTPILTRSHTFQASASL